MKSKSKLNNPSVRFCCQKLGQLILTFDNKQDHAIFQANLSRANVVFCNLKCSDGYIIIFLFSVSPALVSIKTKLRQWGPWNQITKSIANLEYNFLTQLDHEQNLSLKHYNWWIHLLSWYLKWQSILHYFSYWSKKYIIILIENGNITWQNGF